MKHAVLGTGMVGQTLATKLSSMGHEVFMGARSREHNDAKNWLEKVNGHGKIGTFDEAAAYGDIIVNCTQGAYSVEVLRSLDRKSLAGKVLIDVANPLDTSQKPPTLTICNTDSLGESIQREFPEVKVVKALNTVNCLVMVDPDRVPGDHDLFICGNDAGAKATVTALLRDLGWRSIIDMGDISNARATEQLLPIWIRLYLQSGSGDFNFRVMRDLAKGKSAHPGDMVPTRLTPEQMKQRVRSHFQDFVNHRKAEVIHQNMTADFYDHDGPGGLPTGVAGDEAMMRKMYDALPDLHLTIEDMIAEGDKVVCRNIWRWTDPASGKRMQFHGFVLWRFDGDKIAERWATVTPPAEGDAWTKSEAPPAKLAS